MKSPRLSPARPAVAAVAVCIAVLAGVAYAADRAGGEGEGRAEAGGNGATLRDTVIPASEPGEQPIVITRGARRYGSRWPTCTPAEVAVRVRDFTQALASGDAEAMQEYWAPNPEWGRDFNWFTIFPRGRPFYRPWTVDIETLEQGFALLREWGGIRVRIRRLEVLNPGSVGESGGPVDATYRPPQHAGVRKKVMGGKMGIACTGPEIPIFSAGVRKRFGIATCPKPSREVPRSVRRRAMIVCSYGDHP
jgi:hypothetical protein